MKKLIFKIAFLLPILFLATTLQAQNDHDEKSKPEQKYKKTKNYSKTYALSGSDRVELDNKFGEMKLNTWDRNEIKVDVSIAGKSDEEARAQQILDMISIEDSKTGGTVSFKTKFDNKKGDNKDQKKGQHNEGMEINYVVYLPSGTTLDAENQFGSMIIPDYRGEATIKCGFGTLKAGKISNNKSVTVEFSEAEIAELNGGKLSIKFSTGQVAKLSGDIKTSLEFSKVKLDIDNSVKSIDLHNSYSTVYLDVDKNLSATYTISTSHGEFSNKTAFSIQEEKKGDRRYGPLFDRKYNGSSGSGSAKLKINSSFGEIIIGHDLNVNLKEEAKKKSKTKVV